MRIPFIHAKSPVREAEIDHPRKQTDELIVLPAQALLHPHQLLIQDLKRNTSVTENVFNTHYLHALTAVADFAQHFSASANHHHSQQGGMLTHLLDVAHRCVKLSRGYILPPGREPEEINSNEERWRYGVFIAALAHDLGKLIADIETVYRSTCSPHYTIWQPWHGPMPTGAYYQFRHPPKNGTSYKGFHEQLSVTLLPYLITPNASQWVRDDHALLSQMMTTLCGSTQGGGVVEEIIKMADHGSTGDSLNRQTGVKHDEAVMDKPMHLKIAESLRHLVTQGDLKRNHPGATLWITREATWIVSKPGSEKLREFMAAEGISPLPMSAKRLIDILGEHRYLLEHPEGGHQWQCLIKTDSQNTKPWQQKLTCFGIDNKELWKESLPTLLKGSITPCSHSGEPLENIADEQSIDASPFEKPFEIKTHTSAEATSPINPERLVKQEHAKNHVPQLSFQTGQRLSELSNVIAWALNSIKYRKLKVNETQAPVHIVDNMVCFVTPALFNLYLSDNKREAVVLGKTPEEKLKGVQKKVRSLNLHTRHHSGHDFLTIKVNGERIQSTFEAICFQRQLLPELQAFDHNPVLSISDR